MLSSPPCLSPQTPLAELASRLPAYSLTSVGSPMHEDPCLVLLFGQLRSWSLQTVKGAMAVPGKTEFNVSSNQPPPVATRLLLLPSPEN